MNAFLLGFLCSMFGTCSLFFFRFWRESEERLFAYFAISFAVMSVNQLALLAWGEASEYRTAIYGVRLFAFLLILLGIVEKNRRPKRS